MSRPHRTSDVVALATIDGFQVRDQERWRTLLRSRANMLVVGPRAACDAFLRAAEPELVRPIQFLCPVARLPQEPCRTLVILDLAALDADQQRDVLKQTAVAERPQILSFMETNLWRRGLVPTMDADLYYRLNTICLELDAAPLTIADQDQSRPIIF